ncbi:MAG: cyclic nucleotide-binding domain-containing protein [Polyangiaceae bacterium]|nr:cyclic nucleotide-binding domain-containing protein [Polyangiaceae bacterium]
MSDSGVAQFAALTDIGKKRDHNEDNFLVDQKLSLYVVCDGMGGHAAGEVASAMAVRTVHEEVKREAELLADYTAGKTGADHVSKRDVINMLEFAVNRASSKVHAEALKDPSKRGMGTTLVSVLMTGKEAFITYVGDSRAYLLRNGNFEQLTEDHNVYNELIKRKKIPREKVEKLAPKNAVTRAVGVYEHCEPDTLVVDVVAGDRFLLCTDGLSGYFEEDPEALGALLMRPDANIAVQEMIDAANTRGGSDNITAVIVTAGDIGARDDSRAERLQRKRDVLARMPLFRPLSDRELLRVLQVTDVAAYEDGDKVIQEGERGEELFIVLNGKVKVLHGGTQLATLTPGDHFGEMALIRSQPRSATAISDGSSELMIIRRTDFFEILRKEHQLAVKLLWQFLGVLADRLAQTSQELNDAREEMAEDVTNEIFDLHDDEDDNRKTLIMPPPPSIRTPRDEN